VGIEQHPAYGGYAESFGGGCLGQNPKPLQQRFEVENGGLVHARLELAKARSEEAYVRSR